jgi:DNA polymerase-3 subunit epsilon
VLLEPELFETDLAEITFVIVDLETSGGTPMDSAITEIGAVKVRGGEILGEFQTLVNPMHAIPPYISLLTGITDDMVSDLPAIDAILPMFLEWAKGAVLVAHNAPFDIGFLKSAARKLEIPWPGFQVLDTVVIARRILSKDEVPNRKLGTLADYFHSPTQPVHRALADARATNHVLHSLFERLGSMGITTLESLAALTQIVKPHHRKKRYLAQNIPQLPGVYVFKDAEGKPLYVGKSRNLKKRVLTYFAGTETREQMSRMLDYTAAIDSFTCHTDLEASVREARIIRDLKPSFNARGKFRRGVLWLKLTDETYPRLSITRKPPATGDFALGPINSREQATLIIDAITSVLGVRTCTQRLSMKHTSPSCALWEMGRCSAPCLHEISPQDYLLLLEKLIGCINGLTFVEDQLNTRIQQLVSQERFEEAALVRDRLKAWLEVVSRFHRYRSISSIETLIAARPLDTTYEIHYFRRGVLVGAGRAETFAQIQSVSSALMQTANSNPVAHPAEINLILRWLQSEELLLLECSGSWVSPWPSQQSQSQTVSSIAEAQNIGELMRVRKHVQPYSTPR